MNIETETWEQRDTEVQLICTSSDTYEWKNTINTMTQTNQQSSTVRIEKLHAHDDTNEHKDGIKKFSNK